MEAIAKEIIRSFVNVAKDLRFRLKPHDRGSGQLTVHFLREPGHKRHGARKQVRHGGEPGFLIFVDVQIGPVNGGSKEDRVGIALDADLILAAGIDQPRLLLRSDLLKERRDVDAGTDEFEVNVANPGLYLKDAISPSSALAWWRPFSRATSRRLSSLPSS